jgi:iron(III) transport system ATP-binding protein
MNEHGHGGQGMMFEIRNGAVQLGDWVVFEGLNLRVEPGEIVSILGPSGCGKTTLLRASCGLERLKEGQRLLNDEVLENATIVPIITMLFQQPVLYPHLNVSQNIGLGAPKTMSKMAVKQRVDDVLQSIGLADFQRRGTAGLSGGEAQRVAFGRALMQEPTVMLLDEPFASVDVKRRLELSAMTRSHLKERNITTVHVTHDMEEAKTLSDRIVHWHELAVDAQEGVLDGEK